MQLRYSLYMNSTGYSISAQDYIRAIQSVDPSYPIKISAINGLKKQNGISEERYNWLVELSKKKEEKHISIQHCIPRIYIKDRGKKQLGFAIYETIDPPASWVQKMNEMDGIITASSFNKGAFETAGVKKPIYAIPHCFDPSMFNRDVPCKGRYNLFTFMYIATWRDRKNFPSLIKAFYEAFSIKDHVCLLLKTDKPLGLKASIKSIKDEMFKTKETAPIYVEERVMIYEDIPGFMKKADVFISPSLGEGFSISGITSIALDIPLITVKYGGSLEYAKPEFCTYINPAGYKNYLSMDGLPQFKNRIWPDIRISEIRDKMIFAHTSYESLKETSRKGYDYVHQHFNYGIIGRRFISLLKEVEN